MMNIDDLIQRINGALNEPMGRGDERRVRKVLLAALASPPSAPAASGAPPHDAAEAMAGPDVVRDALTDADASWAEYRGVDYWTWLAEAASRAALREGAPAAAVPSPPAGEFIEVKHHPETDGLGPEAWYVSLRTLDGTWTFLSAHESEEAAQQSAEIITDAFAAALASPPSAPAASGAPPSGVLARFAALTRRDYKGKSPAGWLSEEIERVILAEPEVCRAHHACDGKTMDGCPGPHYGNHQAMASAALQAVLKYLGADEARLSPQASAPEGPAAGTSGGGIAMEFDDGGGSGAAPLAPTAERLERIRSAVGDYCAHTGPPLDGDYRCADCEEIVQAVMSALSSPPSAPAASGAPPSGRIEPCIYPQCHMRDSAHKWEGSPEWLRTKTSTSVESAALVSEAHESTGGVEKSNSRASDWLPTEPTLLDLVRELREACGLFSGAMPITPEQAWQEAVMRVRTLCGKRND